jgi:hypothetical protein
MSIAVHSVGEPAIAQQTAGQSGQARTPPRRTARPRADALPVAEAR